MLIPRYQAALPGTWPARGLLLFAGLPVIAGPNVWFASSLTPSFYDHQRLMMVVGVLVVSLFLLAFGNLRTAVFRVWEDLPRWPRWALAGFFALGLVSAVAAPLPVAAFLQWGLLLLGATVALAVAAARNVLGREADLLLLALVVASVSLYTGDFLAFYLPTVGIPDVIISWTSPFFQFNNVRFFNQFQTWTLPLLAGAVVLSLHYSRSLALVIGLLGGFWLGLLLASGSRGAILASVLSTLLTLLFLRARALRWAVAVLGLTFVGLIIHFFLFKSPGGSPGIERAVDKSSGPDQGRLQRWAEALQAAGDYPFLGIGPMHLTPGHPHNALLQVAAEWGIPAALLVITLTGGGLWAWFRSERSQGWTEHPTASPWQTALIPAVSGSLIAGLGHGMVSGTLVMPVSQALAIVVVGWTLGLHQANRISPSPPARKGRALAATGVAVTAMAGTATLAPGFALTFQDLTDGHQAYREQDRGKFDPRFWSQGDICLPPWPARNLTQFCSPSFLPDEEVYRDHPRNDPGSWRSR